MKGGKTVQIFVHVILGLTLPLILVQCSHEGLNVNTMTPVCYNTEIEPIFLNKCATCHSQSKSKGGFGFYDYNSIFSSVTPYDAQKSIAYKAITGKGFTQLMPPDGALSENERILIRVWIDQGAKNTMCATTTPVLPGNGGKGGSSSGTGDVVCFQQDICRFDISMDETLRMCGGQTRSRLHADSQNIL